MCHWRHFVGICFVWHQWECHWVHSRRWKRTVMCDNNWQWMTMVQSTYRVSLHKCFSVKHVDLGVGVLSHIVVVVQTTSDRSDSVTVNRVGSNSRSSRPVSRGSTSGGKHCKCPWHVFTKILLLFWFCTSIGHFELWASKTTQYAIVGSISFSLHYDDDLFCLRKCNT